MISQRITSLATRRVLPTAAACTRAQNMNRTNIVMPSIQHLQRRNAGTAGGRSEPDMGGPGGQEAYPFTNKKHRQYATQTAIGSITALAVLYFILGGSKDKSTAAAAGDNGTSQNPNAEAADKVEKFGRSRN